MKALVLSSLSGPEALSVKEFPDPDLNPAAMRPMLRARMRPDLQGKTGRSTDAKISARGIR